MVTACDTLCTVRLLAASLIFAGGWATAQSNRVLYVTHSAGFRHGSIEVSRRVLAAMPDLRVTATEDLSFITEQRLRDFDAVFFFTSGELALTDTQKRDLLGFVRSGKGFGGVHSATDTLYQWSGYGELIGGYFDGHPWTEPVNIDVEDPDHATTAHLGASFRILEEIYQFRAWDRSKLRVLLTLDTNSVDLGRNGVNRTDNDFAVSWCRPYGDGRVYYNALGHFDETWLDPRFQQSIHQALLWLVRAVDSPAVPRSSIAQIPEIPAMSPGALVELAASELTLGSTLAATTRPLPTKLAGTSVHIGSRLAPIFAAAPGRLVFQVPYGLPTGELSDLAVTVGTDRSTWPIRLLDTSPRVLAVAGDGPVISIYAAGLGEVDPPLSAGQPAPLSPLSSTRITPRVRVGGLPSEVLFSGLAPGQVAVYQVNVRLPAGTARGAPIAFE